MSCKSLKKSVHTEAIAPFLILIYFCLLVGNMSVRQEVQGKKIQLKDSKNALNERCENMQVDT